MLSNTALRLLRRLLGPGATSQPPYTGGTTALLDGATAVAIAEAMISEAAGLGSTFPMQAAELAWTREQKNQYSRKPRKQLSSIAAEGPRGALAAALGQTLTGTRATVFLSGPDLASVQDILHTAVSQHAPLVIHLGLRAFNGAGATITTGHEALQLAATSGAIVLVAANVQEALDFTLIARRVAEQALLPVIVAQDSSQTALSIQDLTIPNIDFVQGFIGHPSDLVAVPNAAQKFIFGNERRRIPCWHDLDRPVLLGGSLPAKIAGISQTGANAYLDTVAQDLLTQTLQEFGANGGRFHKAISSYRAEDADLLLVAQGSAIETAELVCNQVRSQNHIKVGVIGIRSLRPIADSELVGTLGRNIKVAVLERMINPLSGEPPLLTELRAVLSRNHQASSKYPHFLSVIYGVGGIPLQAADLSALCNQSVGITHNQVYLGLGFAVTESPYPKRQVLLDQLRRDYPALATRGLQAPANTDIRPHDYVTLNIQRLAGGPGNGLIPQITTLLQQLLKASVRCRPATANSWGTLCVDYISFSQQPLKDPGDQPPVELAVITADLNTPGLWPMDLARDGALLVSSPLSDQEIIQQLPAKIRNDLEQSRITLYRFHDQIHTLPEQYELLGAIFGTLIEQGSIDVTRWRLLAAQDELLKTEPKSYIHNFTAGIDALKRIRWQAVATVATNPQTDDDIAPTFLRHPSTAANAYDNLPRFWDQVGVLYARGHTAELIPDPYLGLATIPARSSALRDISHTRVRLPVLDPTLCTGCGACWSVCPDGAWGATLLDSKKILDTGIQAAKANSLSPLAGKLASGITKLYLTAQPPRALGEALNATFSNMRPQLNLSEERKANANADIETVTTILGNLPVVATDNLLREPESNAPGSGHLLALALDTDACKGCAMCLTSCAPGALNLQIQDAQVLHKLRRQRQAWELLPSSNPEGAKVLADKQHMATIGAALLANGTNNALAGGDGMEPGSGARLAMRITLGIIEARQTLVHSNWLRATKEVYAKITQLIRNLLSDTLPTDDLDALEQRLSQLGSTPADLSTLLGQVEANATNTIDSVRLQRLTKLAKGLKQLVWRLETGPNGQGRARSSTVLGLSDISNLGLDYPYNPFAGPVTVDRTGDAPMLTAGILEGQVRQTMLELGLLRQAQLELDYPEQASHTHFPLSLEWNELTAEERAKTGQVLLIGDAELLAGRSLGQLHKLLSTGLPVKIVVLAELDLGLAAPVGLDINPSATPDADSELSLLTLAQRKVYVAQSALSAPEHLLTTLEQMLNYPGPALLHLHTPSPSRHGFPSGRTLARTHEAITCGVFPLFRYDPQRQGIFGTCFDLEGNQEFGARTPAHFALGEARFMHLFSPLASTALNPVPIQEYLMLKPEQRLNRTPFLERTSHDGNAGQLAIAPELAKVCVTRRAMWQMLQELAGVITPFTAKVRAEIKSEVTIKHAAELAAQATAYEAKLAGLEEQLRGETRQALRLRLLQLAGYSSVA
ncbi:hypothetical protein TI04_06355 [Achromatium sp. WMS2]|nr:hypothetical protein TI04_06355 [Achromatium sp. WMS2]